MVAGSAAFVSDLIRGSIVGSSAETHFFMCDLEDNRRDVAFVLERLAPRAPQFYVGHFGPLSRSDLEAWLQERSEPKTLSAAER